MITGKQRATLRSMANTIQPIFQIGKGGLTPALTQQLDDALEARELIKIKLLETAEETPKEAAEIICRETGAQSVQIIGSKIVLYREASKEEKRKVELRSK